MKTKLIEFNNRAGEKLSGRIEFPDIKQPHSYAIFAHCFTCNKNFSAVTNICKALNNEGFAVLRFDFTGLGESEGEFSETTFSSNIEDLLDAASYLEANYQAPSLMIGHSLGGGAAVFAARQLDSVKAVVTIASASSPDHLTKILSNVKDEAEQKGYAQAIIAGRKIMLTKEFFDDISSKNMKDALKNLGKPILIFHSPQDRLVGIENAAEIFISARHPKSFIALDGADHLLSDKKDSLFTGSIIGNWAKRYLLEN
jgi:pimeloyl-ACP methyl ester carboxylesterase